jgi:hypothetical protein
MPFVKPFPRSKFPSKYQRVIVWACLHSSEAMAVDVERYTDQEPWS